MRAICFSVVMLSTVTGCENPVGNLIWVVKHPKERDADALFAAVSEVRAAGEGDRAVSLLAPFLNDADAAIRAGATSAIATAGGRSEVVRPILLRMFGDSDRSVRLIAISGLGRIRPIDSVTVTALVAASAEKDRQVQAYAIEALGSMGPEASLACAGLTTRLLDPTTRGVAAKALGHLGRSARSASAVLKKVLSLKQTEGYDRLYVATALYAIDGDARAVVPSLITLLKDDYGPVRRDAATALGTIGPSAAEAIPALRDALQSTRRDERPALGSRAYFGNTERRPTTIAMSDSEFDPQVRCAIEEALEAIGASQSQASPDESSCGPRSVHE